MDSRHIECMNEEELEWPFDYIPLHPLFQTHILSVSLFVNGYRLAFAQRNLIATYLCMLGWVLDYIYLILMHKSLLLSAMLSCSPQIDQ